jgi:argininosuccinate synthase
MHKEILPILKKVTSGERKVEIKLNQSRNIILLAFSGGLDTSAILCWLKDTYPDHEVICYCSDLGNAPDYEALLVQAKQLGASDLIYEDVKELFVKNFAFPAIKAQALYQDDYLLGTALGRPLIAERMAFFAQKLNASYVCHGCTGKGNDQMRLEKSWAYLIPNIKVIAPWRVWNFKGRFELMEYLKTKNYLYNNGNHEKTYSEDVNLFHRSCEGGVLENPSLEFNEHDVYKWVKPLIQLKSEQMLKPLHVKIEFENGLAVKVNDESLSPADLLTKLNQWGGLYGVGVCDLVEERGNGIKSRGVYETPGGAILHFALKGLKHLCWDKNLLNTARNLGQRLGEMFYEGDYHSDLTWALLAFFDEAAKNLTGTVTLTLEPGHMKYHTRVSPYSLYSETNVTFEADADGIHKLADGYIKINTLKNKMQGLRNQKFVENNKIKKSGMDV